MLLALAGLALLLVVGVPAGFYFAQERLLFFPTPTSDARRADIARRFPAVEELAIDAAGGTRLHAWHVRPRGSALAHPQEAPLAHPQEAPLAHPQEAPLAPLAIYFGGNAEEVSWMLEAVGDPVAGKTPGVGWLLVDYRGYGASGGAPSEAALFSDALAWFDRAEKLPGIDARRMFAVGRSLGSGVAVNLASQRPLAGVVLATPYDSMAAVAKHHYPLLPVDSLLKHRFDSLALAPHLRAPLLVIAAERDEVIPAANTARLYEAWRGPKSALVLRGATHNNVDGYAEFWSAIERFVAAQPG